MDCYTAQTTAPAPIFVGCAGWSVPGAEHAHFPRDGTHLERYAAVFPAVEINSSFYRPHRPATYARWRNSVPEAFRFAVKMPKEITHILRLRNADDALEKFISEAGHLQEKLGCLLVQLPPSLPYDMAAAETFFGKLRSLTDIAVVCEPRHATWFSQTAADVLAGLGVVYADADPSVAPISAGAPVAPAAPAAPLSADAPGASLAQSVLRTTYIRLHGSPVIYHSPYSDAYLDQLAARIAKEAKAGRNVWCVFDNTASGAAVPNALSLLARLRTPQPAAQAHLPGG